MDPLPFQDNKHHATDRRWYYTCIMNRGAGAGSPPAALVRGQILTVGPHRRFPTAAVGWGGARGMPVALPTNAAFYIVASGGRGD